ncbi:hypothetical protein EYF80_046330 [Liparis tanakae]|uniref:Uncharacterized protein n=1 Tax=Liparis tanakae TaxID=230148 RepID=A0A4Z2FSU7_9TELE|nr:hypothetical protein EYF80_046330 [Liparis tanakae]
MAMTSQLLSNTRTASGGEAAVLQDGEEQAAGRVDYGAGSVIGPRGKGNEGEGTGQSCGVGVGIEPGPSTHDPTLHPISAPTLPVKPHQTDTRRTKENLISTGN